MGTVFLTVTVIVWSTASAWPVQNPSGQAAPSPPWPWMGGEGEKSFEMPKQMGHPFSAPPPPNGAEGANMKLGPQQKSNSWYQGLGTDPWSSFQTNNPFGSSNPFEFGTQEPTPFENGFNGMGGMNNMGGMGMGSMNGMNMNNMNGMGAMNGNPEDFPYTRPYRPPFAQTQYPQQPQRPMMPDSILEPQFPFPMSPSGPNGPPPRGPMMGMGGHNQMPPPPPQRQHPFGHMQMMGQRGPFDWTRITGRSNVPEMPPPSSAFDTFGRYPIEYSPMKPPNGTIPSITVQYNVTYTFTPWGWRTVDVSVSNATFHTSASERVVEITGAPGGGLVPQPEMNRNQDLLTSGWSWWPKKQGSDKPFGGKPEDRIEATGFGDPAAFPQPPQ